MDSIIIRFLDKARTCQTFDELSAVLESCLKDFGFPLWAYSTEYEKSAHEVEPLLKLNFPDKWVEYYIENNCEQVDPVVTRGKDIYHPFTWDDVLTAQDLSKRELEYQDQAWSHGMRTGLAVPILGAHGAFSMLSVTGDQKPKEMKEHLNANGSELLALAFAYHSMAKDLLKGEALNQRRKILSVREREVVSWTAYGKTAWEIGEILNISERTVVFHLESAKRKLSVNNKYHLVMKAVSMGCVDL